MSKLLDTINTPADLSKLTPAELKKLSAEIREILIDTVTVTVRLLAGQASAITR